MAPGELDTKRHFRVLARKGDHPRGMELPEKLQSHYGDRPGNA